MKGPLLHEPLQLPLAFFASGMAALLFQVLWFRALGRVLGNTVWSGTLVLTAFMLGMAIGGLLAARWAQRIRNPARAFALAETTVALTGSLLVWGLPVLEPLVGQWLAPIADHPTAIAVVRLALALAAMLVPTIAMGLTLALGVRIFGHRETTRALGVLYAANTFGACLAPLAAEYYLIGSLGLRGTALAAACLNGVAAALALRQPAGTALPAAPAAPAPGVRGFPKRLLLAAAVTGGIALALEVIWFRLLILYAPGNDLVFALMLTVVLLGIAIGGALAPLLARVQFAWVTIGSSFAVVAGYLMAGRTSGSGSPDMIQYARPADPAGRAPLGLVVHAAGRAAARGFAEPAGRDRRPHDGEHVRRRARGSARGPGAAATPGHGMESLRPRRGLCAAAGAGGEAREDGAAPGCGGGRPAALPLRTPGHAPGGRGAPL